VHPVDVTRTEMARSMGIEGRIKGPKPEPEQHRADNEHPERWGEGFFAQSRGNKQRADRHERAYTNARHQAPGGNA
jgi:hypothetical protein